MIDLWGLLVENIFGGFYISVAGLSALFLIILILGGVSLLTALWFNGIFLTAMFMGYGPKIVPIILFIIVLTWFFLQLKGFFDRSGGNY